MSVIYLTLKIGSERLAINFKVKRQTYFKVFIKLFPQTKSTAKMIYRIAQQSTLE